jgi:hypothetical protein
MFEEKVDVGVPTVTCPHLVKQVREMGLQVLVNETVGLKLKRVEVKASGGYRRQVIIEEVTRNFRSREGLLEKLVVWMAEFAHWCYRSGIVYRAFS